MAVEENKNLQLKPYLAMNETYVSLFKGAKNPIPLNSDWTVKNAVLAMTYPDNFKDEVDRVRAAKTKEEKTEIKKTLHAITFSGHFSYRSSNKLIKHSGYVCMDIDDVQDLDELRQIVNNDPYTYASFTSCSGKGLAFLVKIDPQKHLDSFLAIEKYYKEFKKIKITADTSCKDVARLRFVTYDPQTYLYEKSLLWDIFEILKEVEKKKERYIPNRQYSNSSDTASQVELLVSRIEDSATNITNNYDDWVQIALALNKEFGDAGEDWFHRISSQDSRYNTTICSQKYKESKNVHTTGIAKLFSIAKNYGITTAKNYQA